MGAVHVRICHDHDFMITQLLFVKFISDPAAESGDHIFYLIGIQNFIETRFFHIEDFSPQRQDRLSRPVPSGLRGAACRISLYQKDFRQSRIFSLQSASLPGRVIPSRTLFLLVRSLAFLAASLA